MTDLDLERMLHSIVSRPDAAPHVLLPCSTVVEMVDELLSLRAARRLADG